MNNQYLTDRKGKKISVVIPIQEYEKMLEQLEELEDIKAYDEAKSKNEEAIPAEKVFQEIESNRNDLQN